MPAGPRNWLATRKTLLTRLKHWDDQEGWRRFFDTYSRLLYSVAARHGFNDAEAQDIVQETVIAVARHMPDFEYDPKRGSFKGWLLHIARSRIIDHLRKRQRQPQRESSPRTATSGTTLIQRLPDPRTPDLERLWEEEWQKNIFDAALKKVKEKVSSKDFQIFDCHVHKQWPVKDVVALLRVSEAYVYTAKSRVSSLLKAEVKKLEQIES